MDEMKITSNLMKGFLSNIIEKKIKKATGLDITVFIGDLNLKNDADGILTAEMKVKATTKTPSLLGKLKQIL